MNLNRVILIGHAGETPELKTTTTSGVVSFSLATSRNWKDKAGSKQEETEWHRIVLWGKLAEVAANFITKGSLVMIEGRLQTRKWQDKQGNQRLTTEVIGEALQLGPKPQATTSRPAVNEDPLEGSDIRPEDLPF